MSIVKVKGLFIDEQFDITDKNGAKLANKNLG